MENKYKPLGYQDLLDRLEYKEMLERMSSTTDPEFARPPTRIGDVYPREPGPTEKFGELIGKGLLKLPYVFEDERSAMSTGQDTANVLAFTPGIGNVLGYLEGQKMTDEGNPLLGSVITGLSAGFGPVAKGSGSIPTPPVKSSPTPKSLEHKVLHTADRPKEIKNVEKWNTDSQAEDTKEVLDIFTGASPYINRKGLMPLRYGDNDTQMTSQIALFESDLYTPKNRNKLFPIENIFQAMRRYGVTGKGNVNQNVKRQIEDFISPEFIANNPKATPASVMEELQKNAPKIHETHAYYNLNSTMEYTPQGGGLSYANYTTRRPLYDLDSPTTTVDDSAKQTSRSYGERSFSMFDDGRIYGKKPTLEEPEPKISFATGEYHGDVGRGRVSIHGTKQSGGENRYMHSRYTLEDIGDDANVYVKQESQSDAYGLSRDQDIIAARVSGNKEGSRMSSAEAIQYEYRNPTLEGDEVLLDRIKSGDFTAVGQLLKTRGDTDGSGATLYNYLKSTGKLDDFNNEFGMLLKANSDELDEARRILRAKNEGDPGYYQAAEDFNEIVDRTTQQEIRLLTKYSKELEKNIKTINLPRSADWFTDDFKLDLQTAVKNDSPYALFPINDRALAPPSGVTTIIPPKMESFIIKKYKDKKNVRLDYDDDGKFLGVSENQDGVFRRVLDAEPDPRSVNRAKSYRDFYKKAIKQTEQHYGVKLNPTNYTDQYGQEYLKITLTPELKSSFQTFRMKDGGAASILPLKYGF